MDSSSAHQLMLNKSQVYQQQIVLLDRYGEQNEIPLYYFNQVISSAAIHGIISGVQFGASLTMCLVLVLLSKHDKRRSPVFLFNVAALLFNIIYTLLQCCISTSSFWDAYPLLIGDYSVVTEAAYRLTVAAAVFVTLVAICIEVSLVLQVHVVSVTLRTWQKMSVLALSGFIAVVAIGFRIGQSVISVRCIRQVDNFCGTTLWLAKAKDISLTVSICFFSAIFCAKLGWSMRERRKLGMKQFGSMQIIFIGGFQTMIIPAVFSLIQFYKGSKIPNIGSITLAATCISLPLTALWAASHAASPSKAARGRDFHRKFLVDSSTAGSNFRKHSDTPQWSPDQSASVASNARGRLGVLNSVDSRSDASSWTKLSPSSQQIVHAREVDRDLEMQELKERD